MKTRYIVFVVLAVLCGCTSFDVFLEVPDMNTADVALYANTVEGILKLESGEAIKLPSGVWRVRLKEGKTNIRLPFVPNELLLSLNPGKSEAVFHIEGEENEQGKLVYTAKPMSEGAKSLEITIVVKDTTGMRIKLETGK